MATIFSLSSMTITPFWFLMIFLPYWRGTRLIMRLPWMTAVLSLLYAILALPQLSVVGPAVLHPTLGGISALLAMPAGVTAGWVHFLAFDLFVGRWIYFDSRERRISAWLSGPILFLTLMLGPLGLFCYLLLRICLLVSKNSDIAGSSSPVR